MCIYVEREIALLMFFTGSFYHAFIQLIELIKLAYQVMPCIKSGKYLPASVSAEAEKRCGPTTPQG